ncbi:MAG TPA: DHA2 family efflux MFS transporter permease subunit [Phenylobacterium sp.]|uniref:DHA2 family efflux MFS transporter permease subunit n=1 Tax=Phenylobacterium sp. TaxID=1871053 RepID=UPI002D4CBC72|nr:DHA2 family efflux MFS transporter permease subunit [Phenylobacterium sp.]HZZ68666.1 DHA2 family efflux MFS transporter permease subunit [Phenylobacterium sp.]
MSPPARARAWVLAGTVLGSGLAFIDSSAVNLTLPVIQQKLGGGFEAAQWIMNAYALMLGALVLAGGAAADRYGRKRVFAAGVLLFTIASAVCGLAPNLEVLIAARAVQGMGAALLTPASLALLGAAYDAKGRGQAVGIWAGASGLTSAVGPVLGGWLTQAVSWRAVFFINLPVAAVAVWLVLANARESQGARSGPVDWAGAGAVTLGLAAITWALTVAPKQGADAAVIGAGGLGVVALAAFLLIERRAANPMTPLTLFRSMTFSGVNAMTLVLYAALSGALFLLPFELIRAQAYAPSRAGAALLPLSVGLGVLSPLSGRLTARVGARILLIVGPLFVAAGFGLLAALAQAGGYWTAVFPGLSVVALGMGIAVAPLTDTVLAAVADEYEGAAAGVNNAVARVAGLLAVALVGFVIGGSDPRAIAGGFRLAMIAAALGALTAALIAGLTTHTSQKNNSRKS